MPKRKREQEHLKWNGEQKSIIQDPIHGAPLRKSARLQQQHDRIFQSQRETKQLNHLNQLPSPSSTHSQDQEPCRKRKQWDTPPLRDDSSPTRQPRDSENGIEVRSTLKSHYNPIEHWVETEYWPPGFAERGFKMDDSNSRFNSSGSNKRPRTSSYTQSVRDGDAPEQYTSAYQTWIGTKGLNMDILKGEELVSNKSKKSCLDLQKITQRSIPYTISPEGTTRKVINSCQTRNEPTVQRVVTTIIIPPIIPLYFSGENHLEHIVDEVNTDWYKSCYLAGPQPRPDLAIGLSSSAFTYAEINKLKIYNTTDNWTRFTEHMYFPFLMCEVKCGKEGIDRADRQNMHSCSVAVRALLRIEQEADKHRSDSGLALLNGRILVFSVSHDHHGARLYGYYALMDGEKWTYHRYSIKEFLLITVESDALALYNFVQNVLKSYVPTHLKRLQDTLAALPDPSTTSFSTSEMALHDNDSQQVLEEEAGRFKKPPPPRAGGPVADELRSLVNSLKSQLEQQCKDAEQHRKDAEQHRKDAEKRNDMLVAQLEQQRKDAEQQRKDAEQQRKDLMALLQSRTT